MRFTVLRNLRMQIIRMPVIFGHSIDRSPCGVGTCAKMATLVAKGELNIGDKFVYESIIRTKFSGRPLEKTKVGDYDAIIPEVTASAYITGFNHFVFDEDEPCALRLQSIRQS